MATWEALCATWSGGSAYVRLNMSQGTQSTAGNWTDVPWSVQSRDTHGSISGTWDWARFGDIGNGSGSVSAQTGTRTMSSGTKRVYHDTNGNGSITARATLDVYYGTGNTGNRTLTLDRIPLAPTNSAPTASNVGVMGARINATASSNGHGTSTTFNMRYRKQGDSTWIERGWGNGTWDLTGLTPGSAYEFASRARNNNNDTTSWSGTYTFDTLPAPSTSLSLLGIVGVM